MLKKILPVSNVTNNSRPIMSTEEFYNSVEKLHPGKYTFLDEYMGYENPMRVIYNECGHEGNPKAKYLHYGKGCPKCHGPANKSHEQFVERIEELYPNKYTFLGTYTKSNEPIKVMYNDCGHIAEPKAAYVRQGAGCPICHRGTSITQEEFLQRFNEVAGDEYEPLDNYVNSKQHMKIRHIPCNTEFERHIGNLFKIGCRCPKCYPSSAVLLTRGVNDIHTVNPEMESLLKNPEDAYNHTQHSKDKLWFICPYCENEIFAECTNVAYYGLKCPRCNTNYSYGERFISTWFFEMGIDFDYQFNPDWIKPYAYDFMFESKGVKYIVEVDGGWHFEEYDKSALSLEEIQERDRYKQQMAEERGYVVIRLDYHYKSGDSKSAHIINSIRSSILYDVLDIEEYDFRSVVDMASKSFVSIVAELWNSYEEKAAVKIQKDLNIKNDNRLRGILYLAYDLGMIKESPEEIKKLNRAYGKKVYGAANSKKVRCVETGEVFDTIKEANEKYHAALYNYFRYDNVKHSGTLPDGTRLTWEKVGW